MPELCYYSRSMRTILSSTPKASPALGSQMASEQFAFALDQARVAVTNVLAAGLADRSQASTDRNLSDVFDSEHGMDGPEVDMHAAESLVGLARARMRAIHAAYERMASGTYGTCAGCGEAIGDERLLAVPETEWCIECCRPRIARHAD